MEKIVAPETRASGSVSNIAASPDPEQTYLYLADSTNNKSGFSAAAISRSRASLDTLAARPAGSSGCTGSA